MASTAVRTGKRHRPETDEFGDNAEAGPSRLRRSTSRPVSTSSSARPRSLVPTPEPPQLLAYAEAFNAHVVDSRRHVRRLPPPAPVDANANPWPRRVRARFFPALSRHSRWRPDLIAYDLGVPELGVRAYLDALEAGVSRRAARRFRAAEGTAPAAREVDDRWIAAEERLALAMADVWEQADVDAALTRKRKRRFRARQKARRQYLVAPDAGTSGTGTGTASGGSPAAPGPSKPVYSDAAYYRAKKLARAEVERLERRWELEDLGERLGPEEMDALESVLAAAWSGRLRDEAAEAADGGVGRLDDGVRTRDDDVEREGDGGDDAEIDTDIGHVVELSTDGRLEKVSDKTLAIAMDDKDIAALSAVPASSLSSSQAERLTTLRNKKAARERYRLKVQLAKGIARHTIDLAGGPDAMFAHLEADGLALKANAKRRASTSRTEPTAVAREGASATDAESAALAESGATYDDAAAPSLIAQKLGGLEAHVYFTKRGLDIFDYSKMERLVSRYHLPSASPTVSFALLRRLHAELLDYLTPLIHESLALADAHASAEPLLDVTDAHVSSALALRGERPERVLAAYRAAFVQKSGPDDNRDVASNVATSEGSGKRLQRVQWSEERWNTLWVDADRAPVLGAGAEDDVSDSEDDQDGAEEDDELDRALEAVDEAYDRLLCARLEAGGPLDDDYDDAFRRPGKSRAPVERAALGVRLGKRTEPDPAARLRALGLVAQGAGALDTAADEARLEYLALLQSVNARRRERDVRRMRGERYAWFSLKREARRLGMYRSAAVVDVDDEDRNDEEEEMEEEETTDEGSVVLDDSTDGRTEDGDEKDDESDW